MSPEPSLNHPQEPSTTPPTPHGGLDTETASFDAWYATYPNKRGKAMARAKWARLVHAERLACIAAQPAWNAYWEARNEPQFIPMASTWVHQRRWHDDVPAVIHRSTPPTRHDQQMAVYDDFLRRHSTEAERTPLGLPKGNS
jgi:hypothetical protein